MQVPRSDNEEVSIPGHAGPCRGWLYRPSVEGPVPIVVLAHGYSATHAFHYWRTAEAFCAAGYAVLDFDARGVGASGGEPRQRIKVADQLADLRAAVRFAGDLDGVTDVVLYGSSAGGGLAIEAASTDAGVAGLILVVPHVDGLSNLPGTPFGTRMRLLQACAGDRIGRLRGKSATLIQVFGEPGQQAVLIDRDGSIDAMREEMMPGGTWTVRDLEYTSAGVVHHNQVAAWEVLELLRFRPGNKLHRVTAPVLMVIGSDDTVTPPRPQRRLAHATGAELVELPMNHFDPFRKTARFDQVIAIQVDFLKRVLARADGFHDPGPALL